MDVFKVTHDNGVGVGREVIQVDVGITWWWWGWAWTSVKVPTRIPENFERVNSLSWPHWQYREETEPSQGPILQLTSCTQQRGPRQRNTYLKIIAPAVRLEVTGILLWAFWYIHPCKIQHGSACFHFIRFLSYGSRVACENVRMICHLQGKNDLHVSLNFFEGHFPVSEQMNLMHHL